MICTPRIIIIRRRPHPRTPNSRLHIHDMRARNDLDARVRLLGIAQFEALLAQHGAVVRRQIRGEGRRWDVVVAGSLAAVAGRAEERRKVARVVEVAVRVGAAAGPAKEGAEVLAEERAKGGRAYADDADGRFDEAVWRSICQFAWSEAGMDSIFARNKERERLINLPPHRKLRGLECDVTVVISQERDDRLQPDCAHDHRPI